METQPNEFKTKYIIFMKRWKKLANVKITVGIKSNKAFGRALQRILLYKLELYGSCGLVLELLSSCLSTRLLYVEFEGQQSGYESIIL